MKRLLLIMLLFSCSEEEITDPITGKWVYGNLKASFEIKREGDSYTATNIIVDGQQWDGSWFEGVTIKKEFYFLVIADNPVDASSSEAIAFYNGQATQNTIHLDSVYHAKLVNGSVVYTKFYNQVLTRE